MSLELLKAAQNLHCAPLSVFFFWPWMLGLVRFDPQSIVRCKIFLCSTSIHLASLLFAPKTAQSVIPLDWQWEFWINRPHWNLRKSITSIVCKVTQQQPLYSVHCLTLYSQWGLISIILLTFFFNTNVATSAGMVLIAGIVIQREGDKVLDFDKGFFFSH